jgi:peptidoglycan/xylan/chitin deacetylase (PgdA/CDA1 family)
MLTDHERQGIARPRIEVDCVIPVLLYHGVGTARVGSDALAVSRAQFDEHLAVIAESGRTLMTIGEIAMALRGTAPLPARPVGITFDDADHGTLTAVESLAGLGMSASVYVIAGDLDTGVGLSRAELDDLARVEGVELGAHSVTHPHLDELGGGALREEIEGSKARLEDLLGQSLDSFAYPYGAFDPRVRAAVMRAGYGSAAAVKNAISHPEDDPWAIARWTIRGSTGTAQLARLLRGEGAPLAWDGERLRTRGYRRARRAWRQVRREGRK